MSRPVGSISDADKLRQVIELGVVALILFTANIIMTIRGHRASSPSELRMPAQAIHPSPASK